MSEGKIVFGYRLNARREPMPFLDYGEVVPMIRPKERPWWSVSVTREMAVMGLERVRGIYPPPPVPDE